MICHKSFAVAELQQTLVEVCRQTLIDGANYVQIANDKYPVRETSRRRLKQVDFRFERPRTAWLEKNPDTKSKWAAMARDGRKVT